MKIKETDDLLTDSLYQQRSRKYTNQQAIITEQEIPLELFTTDKESSKNKTNSNGNNDNDHAEIFENYSPPVYDQSQD
jgi:hypothetical protein